MDLDYLGYIWFLKNTKERKKIQKKNDFLIFGFTINFFKEN